MPADIFLHQIVGLQLVKNALSVVRQALAGQVEVGRVIQTRQHLVAGQELRGDTHFPGVGLQLQPQGALTIRKVGQLGRATADADVSRAVKLDGVARGCRNFQQNQTCAQIVNALKYEGHAGLQALRQPKFQWIALLLLPAGLEGRVDQ